MKILLLLCTFLLPTPPPPPSSWSSTTASPPPFSYCPHQRPIFYSSSFSSNRLMTSSSSWFFRFLPHIAFKSVQQPADPQLKVIHFEDGMIWFNWKHCTLTPPPPSHTVSSQNQPRFLHKNVMDISIWSYVFWIRQAKQVGVLCFLLLHELKLFYTYNYLSQMGIFHCSYYDEWHASANENANANAFAYVWVWLQEWFQIAYTGMDRMKRYIELAEYVLILTNILLQQFEKLNAYVAHRAHTKILDNGKIGRSKQKHKKWTKCFESWAATAVATI